MSTTHTENTVNDYSNFGFNPIQPETVAAAGKASKKVAIALFAATAAGVAYVATRPRVRRAIKELMTPEPTGEQPIDVQVTTS